MNREEGVLQDVVSCIFMKYKVMICDDSKLMRKKMKNFLKENYSNIDVLVAENGKEAVELYNLEKPNLVFLDIVMPILDGIGALKQIRSFDSMAKVVITSSSGTKQKLKEALEYGAVEFIQKPWSPEQIKFIINKFMAEGE